MRQVPRGYWRASCSIVKSPRNNVSLSQPLLYGCLREMYRWRDEVNVLLNMLGQAILRTRNGSLSGLPVFIEAVLGLQQLLSLFNRSIKSKPAAIFGEL